MSVPISLIITVYNRERYLAEAIESVLSQTRGDFELLIWDDGSTDDSLAIACSYEEKDKRVRVVAGSHQGFTKTLCDAVALTTGTYLGWIEKCLLLTKLVLAIFGAEICLISVRTLGQKSVVPVH